MEQKQAYANNTEVLKGKDGSVVIQIKNEKGQVIGTITQFTVIPGISINYNDFYMSQVKSNYIPSNDMFCIEHCREGRIEQEIRPGVYRYTAAEEIRLDNKRNHATNFYFPLSHYHGLTVSFNVTEADASINKIFMDFPVTVESVRNRYCSEENCVYLRNSQYMDRIFEQLYNAPQKIKKHYIILKVLELLLFLSEADTSNYSEPVSYYAKNQTDKVKEICNLISNDLQKHYTLENLATRYDMSVTSMKSIFKGIYGKPIYTWVLEKKMQKASKLMLETNMTIAEIANEIGYENPSKFSSAFKKMMNLTPVEFRRCRNK